MSTQLPLSADFEAVTRCLRCRRQLIDPVSVARGYGPYCWQIVGPVFTSMTSDEEGDGGVPGDDE